MASAINLLGETPFLSLLAALMAYQVIRSTTDWTIKGFLNYIRNTVATETTSREATKGNRRAVEIERKLEENISKKEEKISNYERMIRSLRGDNISKGRVIEQYWRPLPAIIITFFKDYSSGYEDKKFIKEHILENNEASMLTGNTYAIPPEGLPARFDEQRAISRQDIATWVREDIMGEHPGGKAVICQASAVDLRRVFSHTDYASHSFDRKTIEQALDIESILSRNNVTRLLAQENVNLSRAIESGDIAFFLSRYISEEELDLIHQNQDMIRDSLDNPPLREIAREEFAPKLADAISPYIQEPQGPAAKAVEEAQLWHRELQR